MRVSASVLWLSVSLAGCSALPAPSEDGRPIPLDLLLGQMKCEFALSFRDIAETKPRRLQFDGWFIDGKLTAKIENKQTAGGSVGTAELVPLGGSASGGFRFGAEVTRARTSTAIIDFVVAPSATDTSVCDAVAKKWQSRVVGLGIYDWLKTLDAAPAGEPRMAYSKLSYTLDFVLTRTGNAGIDILVTPVKLTADAKRTRDDTQQLVMTLSMPDEVTKALKAKVASGTARPGPFHVGGTGSTIFSLPIPPLQIQGAGASDPRADDARMDQLMILNQIGPSN